MSGGQVRIGVLGRLAVERDGAVTATGPGGRRAELALALLAIEHRRLVTRDELADALWPELLPDSWAAALRAVVSDVRRFLDEGGLDGGALVERSQGGYRLLLPAGAVLDVDDAVAAVEEARRLLDGDPAGAAQRSGQAATVAALPFLPDHEGPGSTACAAGWPPSR